MSDDTIQPGTAFKIAEDDLLASDDEKNVSFPDQSEEDEELETEEDYLLALDDEQTTSSPNQQTNILPLDEINKHGLLTVLEEKDFLDNSDGTWIEVASRSAVRYNEELSVPDAAIYLVDAESLTRKRGENVRKRDRTFIAPHNPNNVIVSSIKSWPAENFHAGHLIPLSSFIGLPEDRAALSSHLVILPQDPIHNSRIWLAGEASNNCHIKDYGSGIVKSGAIFDKCIDGSSTEIQFIGGKNRFAVPTILYSSTLVYCSETEKYLRSTWITENKEANADMLLNSLSSQAQLSNLGIPELFKGIDYVEITPDSKEALGPVYDKFIHAVERGCRVSSWLSSTIVGSVPFKVKCANPNCPIVYERVEQGFVRSIFGGKLGEPRCNNCANFYSRNKGKDRQFSTSAETRIGMSLAKQADPIPLGVKCANPNCPIVYKRVKQKFKRSIFGGKLGEPRCGDCGDFYSQNEGKERQFSTSAETRAVLSLAHQEGRIPIGVNCANPGCTAVYTETGQRFIRSIFGGKLGKPRCYSCAEFYSQNKGKDRVITDDSRKRALVKAEKRKVDQENSKKYLENRPKRKR